MLVTVVGVWQQWCVCGRRQCLPANLLVVMIKTNVKTRFTPFHCGGVSEAQYLPEPTTGTKCENELGQHRSCRFLPRNFTANTTQSCHSGHDTCWQRHKKQYNKLQYNLLVVQHIFFVFIARNFSTSGRSKLFCCCMMYVYNCT